MAVPASSALIAISGTPTSGLGCPCAGAPRATAGLGATQNGTDTSKLPALIAVGAAALILGWAFYEGRPR
jgi:hypothetical protein